MTNQVRPRHRRVVSSLVSLTSASIGRDGSARIVRHAQSRSVHQRRSGHESPYQREVYFTTMARNRLDSRSLEVYAARLTRSSNYHGRITKRSPQSGVASTWARPSK